MSAFKTIAYFKPRHKILAKFRLLDGLNLPKQVVLFSTLPEFREHARRISATTAGKLDFDAALFAVDNENPKPSYNSKQIRFHIALREDLLKRRQAFIISRQAEPKADLIDNTAKILDDVVEDFFNFVKIEVHNPKSITAYRTAQAKVLNLKLKHDAGFIKRLGAYRFEELEFDVGGTGYKIISALRSLVDKNSYSENSLYLAQQQIKRFFKWLRLTKKTSDIPLYPKVPQPEAVSVPFEDDELERLEADFNARYETGDKNYLRGFFIARFTGARVHEIANLQIKHWVKDGPQNSHFKLPKAKGKKKVKAGSVGILLASNDILIDFLEKDFEGRDPEEYILAKEGTRSPWKSSVNTYTTAFSKVQKALGIFKQPWHAFRHTGAIELYEITGDIYQVKAFLRHELIETTRRYLNLTRVNAVVEQSQNFLGKKFVKTARDQQLAIGDTKLLEAA